MLRDVLFACILLLGSAFASADGLSRIRGKPVVPGPKLANVDTGPRDPGYAADKVVAVRLTSPKPVLRDRGLQSSFPEKRVAVGMPRDIASEIHVASGPAALAFQATKGGGASARLAVTSPQASSLRVGLRVRSLPPGAELRFVGNDAASRTLGPVSAEAVEASMRAQGIYWTPVTEGETQTVEVWIPPGADAAAVDLRAESASHLAVTPTFGFKSTGVGAAGQCHEDVACVAPYDLALARASRSVAKLVYTENGTTYLCTGTLINDGNPSSQVPYLLTAAHCIGSAAAALSLNTFWFFEAASCGGSDAGDYRQLAGGATLLYASRASDVSLVRLADRAPENGWFAGWDPAPLAPGSSLVALHHPVGDLKKLAKGVAVTAPSGFASRTTSAWVLGATEPGSSGSGIFTLADGEYFLRGGLLGGSASCSSSGRVDDPLNRDYYSRLDREAINLKAWLTTAPMPLADFTGMWSNPEEPGWGLSIVQDAGRIFVTWFSYDADGQPTWLVIPEGKWLSAGIVEGTIYRTSGGAFDLPYAANRFSMQPVGMARIDFGDPESATLDFTLDGRSWIQRIRRLTL